MQAENEKLQAESKKLEGEITELSKNIVARNASLEKQARSAQTNGAKKRYDCIFLICMTVFLRLFDLKL